MAFQELRLTSPHMKGPNVRKAQQSLAKNRFGHFYEGKIDGVYGPETAGATKEAKFKLGYPKREVNQHYDERLDGALNGRHDISPAMKVRRRHRTKPTPENNKAAAANLAVTFEGYHEGANNANQFGAWYGLNNAPWCAIFVSYCEGHSGNDWFRYSYCPSIYSAAQSGVHGMRFTTKPEKGDLALFHFSGGEYPCSHVGIVLSESPWRWVSGNFGDSVDVSTADRLSVVKFVRLPS